MNRALALSMLVYFALLSGFAPGQCPFTIDHDADSVVTTCTEVASGVFDLELEVTDTDTVILDVIVGSGSPRIRNLVFELTNGSGTGPVVIATIKGPFGSELNLAGLDSVDLVTSTGGELYFDEIYVNGDLGALEAQRLDFLRVTGSVIGPISMLEIPAPAFSSKVGVVIVDGDFLSSIGFPLIDSTSEIDTLSVGGDIGTEEDPVSISAGSAIGLIECENLYADVANAYAGTIQRIVTSGVFHGNFHAASIAALQGIGGSADPGVFIGTGDWLGSMTCTIDLDGDIDIPGDLAGTGYIQVANIDATDAVAIGGAIESGASVDILSDLAGDLAVGGDMAGTITIYDNFSGSIETASAGLLGQIVINQQDNCSTWTGDVTIGSVVIGPGESQPYLAPYYEVLSTTLGGGAIGLVPFNFHPKDAAPDHGETILNTAPTRVAIHHYGPVADADDDTETTPPVLVFEAALMAPFGKTHHGTNLCDAMWTDVTSRFEYSVSGRVVTISNDSGSFLTNKAYQIIPIDLVCDDVPGNPAVVYVSSWTGTDGCGSYPDTDGYGFKVATGFDMNMNGSLEGGDVETWLATPADLDGDDDADNTDLILLVDAVTNGGE